MSNNSTKRRQYLQLIGATAAGDTLFSQTTETIGQTSSGSLLEEDFEDYDLGSFPETWNQSGNSNQQVVADPVASGDQALEMIGSHGGCWQALSHYELPRSIPSDTTVIFSGYINPTGNGGGGCHGPTNGAINLQDSPASAGGREYRQNLVKFEDGTVKGQGVELGSYEIGSYNAFEIEYYWDSNTAEIELTYWINGENRGTGITEATTDDSGNVVESDLVHFTVTSGDYTLYVDNLSVNQGQDRNNSSVTETPQDSYQTRLRDAEIIATVTLDGQEYHVLTDIPDEPEQTYAYTTSNFELLEPALAADVAITYEFCSSYSIQSEERLEYTTEQAEEADGLEQLARTAQVLTQLSGAVALAAISPTSSLIQTAQLTAEVVSWAEQDLNRPYERQYLKIAAATNTLNWANQNASNPDGAVLWTDDTQLSEILETGIAAAELIDTGSDITESVPVVVDVFKQADSITTNVDPSQINGIQNLRANAYTALAGLAVSGAVNYTGNIAEAQAQSAALLRGSANVRRSILNEIISLETRVRDYRVGPEGILRLQALKQTDYQIEAAAWHGVHEIYNALSDSLLGVGYETIFATEEFAERAAASAESWETLSYWPAVATGEHSRRALDTYRESLNYDEFGDQTVVDYP